MAGIRAILWQHNWTMAASSQPIILWSLMVTTSAELDIWLVAPSDCLKHRNLSVLLFGKSHAGVLFT